MGTEKHQSDSKVVEYIISIWGLTLQDGNASVPFSLREQKIDAFLGSGCNLRRPLTMSFSLLYFPSCNVEYLLLQTLFRLQLDRIQFSVTAFIFKYELKSFFIWCKPYGATVLLILPIQLARSVLFRQMVTLCLVRPFFIVPSRCWSYR